MWLVLRSNRSHIPQLTNILMRIPRKYYNDPRSQVEVLFLKSCRKAMVQLKIIKCFVSLTFPTIPETTFLTGK